MVVLSCLPTPSPPPSPGPEGPGSLRMTSSSHALRDRPARKGGYSCPPPHFLSSSKDRCHFLSFSSSLPVLQQGQVSSPFLHLTTACPPAKRGQGPAEKTWPRPRKGTGDKPPESLPYFLKHFLHIKNTPILPLCLHPLLSVQHPQEEKYCQEG